MVQCLLNQGNKYCTSWIDIKYAKCSTIVSLKGIGKWEVNTVYESIVLPRQFVVERSRDCFNTRKVSDA